MLKITSGRVLFGALALLGSLILTGPAANAEETFSPLPKDNQVAEALKKFFPQVAEMAEEYRATPVAGLYEVYTPKGLLYFFPASGHIIAGQLMDSKGNNLTKESVGRAVTKKLDTLPLDQAIKIGSGKNQVIEFTDPDCPYCRQGSAFFAKRKDVTRYVFLFPLKMHPKAEEKARYILSSANPAKAYEEVMAGKYDATPLPAFKDNGKLSIHLAAGNSLSIRSTPTYWVNGEFVSGANTETFEKLLGDKPTNKTNGQAQTKPSDQPGKYARPDAKTK